MKKYVLALDQGTTSSRAVLFDREGKVRAIAQQELAQSFPAPGLVEHDPMEIWTSQLAVARKVMRDTGVSAADIAAIGIANQRETTVVWDRVTGEPVHPAIVWQDRRTAQHCDQMRSEGREAAFQRKTGLLLDPYFSATKLQWILQNVPGAEQRAQRGQLAFGTVDSWLAFQLCGRHVTDASNASRTLLFNIHSLLWDASLASQFGVSAAMLPELVPTSGILGVTAPELFGAPIPIAALAGDQQAACFGQACLRPGMAKNTYGTGCFMLMNTGAEPILSRNRLLTSVGWTFAGSASDRCYVLEGSVFSGGSVVQWIRDGLGLIGSAAEIEALATSVPDAGGVVLVPAFTGLGAPYWDPHARGAITGITRGTAKAHIARAALECIAYQSADLLHAMQQDAGMPMTELRVDGGASRNDFLMQFQADILGVEVIRPAITETTSLGVAFLAGLAVGYWDAVEEVSTIWREEKRYSPQIADHARLERLQSWHEAVGRSRGAITSAPLTSS